MSYSACFVVSRTFGLREALADNQQDELAGDLQERKWERKGCGSDAVVGGVLGASKG
jgi:hypothetical protein